MSNSLQKRDGRTREARLAKALRQQLEAHVGGGASVVEKMLIDQAVQLQLRLATADGRDFVETSMALTSTLDRIGIKAVAGVAA